MIAWRLFGISYSSDGSDLKWVTDHSSESGVRTQWRPLTLNDNDCNCDSNFEPTLRDIAVVVWKTWKSWQWLPEKRSVSPRPEPPTIFWSRDCCRQWKHHSLVGCRKRFEDLMVFHISYHSWVWLMFGSLSEQFQQIKDYLNRRENVYLNRLKVCQRSIEEKVDSMADLLKDVTRRLD